MAKKLALDSIVFIKVNEGLPVSECIVQFTTGQEKPVQIISGYIVVLVCFNGNTNLQYIA